MAFGFKHGSKNLIRFIAKPVVSGAYTFDTTEKTAVINGFDAKAMTISGVTSATSAGTYTLVFTLKKGYMWSDKSSDVLTRTWSIAKRSITIPSMTNKSFTWGIDKTFSPTISGVSDYVIQSGTTSSTDAGSWTVTWELKYAADTQWTDSTTADKTDTWTVSKLSLAIPYISSSKSFAFVEGASHSVTITDFNGTYETQSGTTSSAALSSYTITWALQYTSNTQWSDGTITNKTASWANNWVNGTSHYNADIYNKGWYKSNSLQFTDQGSASSKVVNWNSDNLEIQYCKMRTSDPYVNKTIHFSIRHNVYSGSMSLPASIIIRSFNSSWGTTTLSTTDVGSSYTEISANCGTNTSKYPGIQNGSNPSASGAASYYRYQIQRIWIT